MSIKELDKYFKEIRKVELEAQRNVEMYCRKIDKERAKLKQKLLFSRLNIRYQESVLKPIRMTCA